MIRNGERWHTRAEVLEALRRVTSRRDAAEFRRNAEATPAGATFLESAEWTETHWAKTFVRQLVDEAMAAEAEWRQEYHTDPEFHAAVDGSVAVMARVDAALCRELSPAERERVWRDVIGDLLGQAAATTAIRRRLLAGGMTVQRVGAAEFVIGDAGTFERVPASLVVIPPAEVDPLLHGDAA